MLIIYILSLLLIISIILNVIYIKKHWYIKNAKKVYKNLKQSWIEQELLKELNVKINHYFNSISDKKRKEELKNALKTAKRKTRKLK